ncbi:unnamed protein product [Paramecium sonneborni]|uniref:WD40-repeat-containing domain n=1 Tax=Paramecium sonneborni TaxID=65129 RepID=A0A8S1LF41_9CILI|nr:unnamed protein product [Paramecium sonneborni]
MIQSRDFEICRIHNEKIVYIDKQQSDISKKGLCHQCVAEQEKNKNLKMIDDIRTQLSNFKDQLIQNREYRTQWNIDLLRNLQESLHKYQVQFCQQTEKCIQKIHQQINLFKNAKQQYQMKVSQITINDLNGPDKVKSQIKQEFIDCKGIKSILLNQMNNFEVFQMKNICEEQIQKIDFGDQNLELEQLCNLELFQNEKEQYQKWKCDEHKEEIMFIDLEQIQRIPNRLACKKCVPKYNCKFTDIEDLQNLWQQYFQETQKQIHLYMQQSNKVKKQMVKLLQEFKTKMNEQIDQLFLFIEQQGKFDCNKALYKPFQLLQRDLQTISKDEIIIIANSVSNENKEFTIKKYVRNEFINKEIVLKETIYKNMQIFQKQLETIINNLQQLNLTDNDILLLQENNKRRLQNQTFVEPQSSRNLHQKKFILKNDNCYMLDSNIDIETYRNYDGQISPIKKGVRQMQNKFKLNLLNVTLKHFKYEIFSQIEESTPCLAIAINSQATILVVGQYRGIIKVFSINNGFLNQIQILQENSFNIRCLYFMKGSQSFLSGSNDKSILIWKQGLDQKWYNFKKLEGHSGYIQCLIMNNQENLIISGSQDKTIKFWAQEIDWQCQFTFSGHNNSVRSISLNSSNNQLISCAEEELQILIIQLQNDLKTWALAFEIKVDYWGYSVIFINDHLFSFQPHKIDQIYLFQKKNIQENQFQFKQCIEVKCEDDCTALFPQMYLKSKQILMTKNGRYINLIRKNKNGQFTTEQSIQNADNCCGLYGSMTFDGEYLFTWEDQNHQIIVRKFKEY